MALMNSGLTGETDMVPAKTVQVDNKEKRNKADIRWFMKRSAGTPNKPELTCLASTQSGLQYYDINKLNAKEGRDIAIPALPNQLTAQRFTSNDRVPSFPDDTFTASPGRISPESMRRASGS